MIVIQNILNVDSIVSHTTGKMKFHLEAGVGGWEVVYLQGKDQTDQHRIIVLVARFASS